MLKIALVGARRSTPGSRSKINVRNKLQLTNHPAFSFKSSPDKKRVTPPYRRPKGRAGHYSKSLPTLVFGSAAFTASTASFVSPVQPSRLSPFKPVSP